MTKDASAYVDWEFAKTTGQRLASGGPQVTPQEARGVVAAIADAAASARGPVAETSRLHTPDDAPDALVVDRGRWIATNADSMKALMEPVFAAVLAKRPSMPAGLTAVGGKMTGAEAGGLLAYMSSKVLGQYDIAPQGTPALLLVAPNIVHVQRELGVDPADFRAWVCMHEETHRVQFTAVPWLREHLITRTRTIAVELAPDPAQLVTRTREIVQRLPEVFGEGGAGLADLVTTPEQREQLAEVTAIMSLLEGHADVVMDEVGPAVIPTVATIRERFNARRKGAGASDKLLRRLLGLEAKMRQYRDGAFFVRGVVDAVGWDGFNAVWTSAETLPRPVEITEPTAWVARVHA